MQDRDAQERGPHSASQVRRSHPGAVPSDSRMLTNYLADIEQLGSCLHSARPDPSPCCRAAARCSRQRFAPQRGDGSPAGFFPQHDQRLLRSLVVDRTVEDSNGDISREATKFIGRVSPEALRLPLTALRRVGTYTTIQKVWTIHAYARSSRQVGRRWVHLGPRADRRRREGLDVSAPERSIAGITSM